MSQDYKLKFDQMRESQPGNSVPNQDAEYYGNVGNNRNVDFVLPNGDSDSFNYAYLVSTKLRKEQKSLFLIFTTDTVQLKGYGLEKLKSELFDQRNRIITCVEERYAVLESAEIIITEIIITKN